MNREKLLQNIDEKTILDIVIIGGGATGLGAALDAASRGYKTLLIEKKDFGSGTSSKSTKLIHGGVRYLEQGNFRLVKEALEERGYMLRNAASCTSKVDFILPVYTWWHLIYYYLGLKLYEWMSGIHRIGSTKVLSDKAVIHKMPGISGRGLKAGILYHDGQFNDSKLCILLGQTAVHYGATVLNYAECTGFEYENGKISAVLFTDLIHQKNYRASTKSVINATGAFADSILRLDNPDHEDLIAPSLGIHVVTDLKTGIKAHGLLIPRTTDGRVLFAIPWMNKVIIGTTDSSVESIGYDPDIPSGDVGFIIKNINRYLENPISEKDIKSVFAGIRPLVKGAKHDKTSSLPRDHTIIVSASGMISIIGGKWTTYRKMSEDVVNKAAEISGFLKVSCRTKDIKLDDYGNQEYKSRDSGEAQKIHQDYPFVWSDVTFAIENEMAVTLEDVLARRLRLLFLDTHAAAACASAVAGFMQQEMHQSDKWRKTQIAQFLDTVKKHQINHL